jgi:hypothetical protein
MNFVVENSNKLEQIGFRRENELSVFTFWANNTCYLIKLSMKEGNLFCFVIMVFLKPWYFKLCYGTYHQKVLNE